MNKLNVSNFFSSSFEINWELIFSQFSFIFEKMKVTEQNPIWHGEGSVWNHTKKVCESLVSMEEFQILPERQKEILFLSALFHDIGKIITTKSEDGELVSPFHASKGSFMVRELLWEFFSGKREDFLFRETVSTLVKFHGKPHYFVKELGKGKLSTDLKVSKHIQTLASYGILLPDFNLHLLSLLAKADCMGRISKEQNDSIFSCELFEEEARNLECLENPPQFSDEYSRWAFFKSKTTFPKEKIFNSTWGEVVIMSGLPYSGKDTWIQKNFSGVPIISLDEIRTRKKDLENDQAKVVHIAREEAKIFLRNKIPFIWNSTNLLPELRQKQIQLFSDYGAFVRMIYLETSLEKERKRWENRERIVPLDVLSTMRKKMELPQITETHRVEWLEN